MLEDSLGWFSVQQWYTEFRGAAAHSLRCGEKQPLATTLGLLRPGHLLKYCHRFHGTCPP